jgi:hypothetical protein
LITHVAVFFHESESNRLAPTNKCV